MAQSSPTTCSGASRLTAADRDLIARARQLAGASFEDLRQLAGAGPDDDAHLVLARAGGIADVLLLDLAAAVERLAR